MIDRIRLQTFHLLVTVLMLLAASGALAQDEETAPVNPDLAAVDDAYLNRQSAALLAEVSATLEQVKPQWPEPRERTLALRLLDAVLHEPYAPARPPVQDFYHARMAKAAAEIEASQVTEGARIWKLYNHGFIVRTASVTLAFDLNPGPAGFRVNRPDGGKKLAPCPEFPMDAATLERIVSNCDVLFISHVHGDHACKPVAELFIAQGKPVVAPENVFENTELHAKITHLKREAHTIQSLPIHQGKTDLKVVVYPGQQYQDGGPPNNVVIVYTPEGMTFAHNGDQINDPYPEYQEDYKWIDVVHEHHNVDVYMTNCWGNDLYRDVRGFDPNLVLPGHENELSHPLWDRVPYWGDSEYLKITYPELKASAYPVVVMTWGESYDYIPASAGETPAP